MRLEPFEEVSEPQGRAFTVGHVAAPVPLLAVPLLAGAAGEAVDSRTLGFLFERSLAEKKEEEEQRKAEVEELRPWRALGSSTGPRGRERKRRKRRTSRTSSRSLRGRARRTHRQWHACNAGFLGHVPLLAVFPLVVDRLEMLCIMAGMIHIDSYARLWQWHVQGWFCSDFAPCAVLSSLVGRPMIWSRWTVMRLAVACTRLVLMVTLHLALLSSLVCRPTMLGIMAGMVQMDSYALGSGMYKAGMAGGNASRAVFAGMRGSLFGAWAQGRGVMSTGT